MESPFFASRRNPIRYANVPQPRPRPPAAKARVVSIPVHFVGPEKEEKPATKPAAAAATQQPAEVDRAVAVVKIQKVFRGFLVRKNVRVVHKVAAEVDEIERKIREEVEVIRRDGKERLRVNEMLMALLLRLDSVRGVRDYRKKVIRKVISLQDAVDSIATSRDEKEVGGETPGTEIGAPAETPESKDEAPESKGLAERPVTIPSKSVEEGNIGNPMEETLGNSPAYAAPLGTEGVVEESELEEESAIFDPMEQERPPEIEAEERSRTLDQMQGVAEVPAVKEAMERVMAENETLKRLVSEFCERSAQLSGLMGGLVERVEHLERRMEKRRKKKTKRKHAENKHHLFS